ncbi:MAG TPA: ABC transporter ATP-binding protein [Candidatus Baltobacteraceae bacterium]|nr:ABC transporter ATP-binding protein [Candidatus Baltobacteraceae bacterium]
MMAVTVHDLGYTYGARTALAGVTFAVPQGEIFGLLGPNGGGKTTLFKILSTLLAPASGTARVFEHTLPAEAAQVRRHLGVVFQRPSLDLKLTVHENLIHHGWLYGMHGAGLRDRCHDVLRRFRLADRAGDLVETLSGGLQRRTELAKALMPRPDILLLDEPSTGLDPGARRDFMHDLGHLRREEGTTVLLTTHILDEADRCDRLGVLDGGRLVALGTPSELKAKLGGDVVVIHSDTPDTLRSRIHEQFGHTATVVEGNLRLELPDGHEFVRAVVAAFGSAIETVSFGKPTLEDVFIHLTGHRLWAEEG